MKPLTVSEAKPRLGRLVDDALRAKPVFIRRGNQVVQLVPAILPDPIPVYAPGALARTDAEIALLSTTATTDSTR